MNPQLNQDIEFGPGVAAIALPTMDQSSLYDEGAKVTLAGWGGTEAGSLAGEIN